MSFSISKSYSLKNGKSVNNEEKSNFFIKFNTQNNNNKNLNIDPIENFQKILEEKYKAMESLDYLDDIDDEKSSEIFFMNNIEIISSAFDSCASSSSLMSESESQSYSKNYM